MAKCDFCDNPATVHMTEIKGGEKTQMHLCEFCAKQMHPGDGGSGGVQKVLEGLDPKSLGGPPLAVRLTCPQCGMTYAEFKQHGRFGCANDYEVFGAELKPLFKRIHGSTRYCGKTPDGGAVDNEEIEQAVRAVRAKLDQAIREERYEDAARMRDEIRVLEAGEAQADVADNPDRDEGDPADHPAEGEA